MSFWKWLVDLLKPPHVPVPPIANEASKIILFINIKRAYYGKPALIEDYRLSASAQDHCDTMARLNILSHQCLGEKAFNLRIADKGFSGVYVAECIEKGLMTAEGVVNSWMDELPPNNGHRLACLGPATRIGSGVALNKSGVPFWTTDFGKL